MDYIANWIAVLIGIAARLVVPIFITLALVYLLRRLDANWQAEAQAPAKVEKPACWEIKGCAPEQRDNCLGYSSPFPCWQARRTANGYLREECLACKVFVTAPAASAA